MHAPIQTTPPANLPVSLTDAKLHLRVDHDDEDLLIDGLIEAATDHLDGWTGILGRCLEEQEWRQDFDWFAQVIRLPLWPVNSISSITWRDIAGQIATVHSDDYALKSDALGAYVRFKDGFSYPNGLHQNAAISVTFNAGYPQAGDPLESTVPAAIKAAILLLVGHWYQNREAVSDSAPTELPLAVNSLIAPYRRTGL